MLKRIINLYKIRIWPAEKYARSVGVTIGENCVIGTKWFGTEPYLIEIGNRVQITNGVRFFTHGGSWILRGKYPEFDFFGKIKIGDNVYIGNCAMIMPGVIIENNVLIAAGSVVTKSVPAGSIIGGNPGKVIGSVNDFKKKHLKYNTNTAKMGQIEKRGILKQQDIEMFIVKPFYKLN